MLRSALALAVAFAVTACSPEPAQKTPPAKPAVVQTTPHAALKPFASAAALSDFLKKLPPLMRDGTLKLEAAPPMIALEASAPVAGMALKQEPSITNNQVAGVDEGDIVKAYGDVLVILRRGRLFTVAVANGKLTPVDKINAYPPGVDPRSDWYDEVLVGAGRVIVIGYSYERGGTEVNRFRIDKAGHLAYEDSYHIRSNDYYSSRNYASRLVGNTLVFYTPLYVPRGISTPETVMPALSRWSRAKAEGVFTPVGSAMDVYLSPGLDGAQIAALHSVMLCDITAEVLTCKGRSAFGPAGRVFFVSTEAVYVWTTQQWLGEEAYKHPTGVLFRLPFDGSAPEAVGVRGAPTDQFSFREAEGAIDVLIRAQSVGEAMWASEASHGRVALVHVPHDFFGDGSKELPRNAYRGLVAPKGDNYPSFQNRFVGDHVLYGEGNGPWLPQSGTATLFVAPVAGGDAVSLTLPHGVDRIEAMGGDAVVVGSDGRNVVFSAVSLKSGKTPVLGDRYVLAGASQAETRSHGFFFKPEGGSSGRNYDGDWGVLGLPVMRSADPAYRQLFREAASVVFVRRSDGKFSLLGDLPSHPQDARDDACKASCVDWYGNSRPIFFGSRTFALMGYELVEAVLGQKDMAEKGRVNFAPH